MFNYGNHGICKYHEQHFHSFVDRSIYETDEFRMYGFKINLCPKPRSHDWTVCPFAHRGEKAQRRDPRKYKYAAIPCPNFKKDETCEKGDACEFAHGVFEFWLHPAVYRTNWCHAGPFCDRRVCFFAHTEEELRCESKYNWCCVYNPVQPYRGIGYQSTSGVVVPFAPRHAPPTIANQGNSDVVSSLEMLNIKNGKYEMPKTVGWGISDSDLPNVNWVSELVENVSR